MAKQRSFIEDSRGVSAMEYALLIAAILLVGAGGYRLLGNVINTKAACAGTFGDNCGGAGGGGDPGAGGAGGGEGVAAPSQSGSTTAGLAPGSSDAQVRGQASRPFDATLARLADDTYHYDNGIPGWNKVSPQDLTAAGVNPAILENSVDGFKSDIYTDGQGHYVLAYRGTAGSDWSHPTAPIGGFLSDANQGFGHPDPQYAQALAVAKQAKAAYGDNLTITGHSLGGGLATDAALATNTPAVVFNPAGVHPNTEILSGVNPLTAGARANDGLIRNYVVNGEILNTSQDAVGGPVVLPRSVGTRYNLDPAPNIAHDPISLHNGFVQTIEHDQPWK